MIKRCLLVAAVVSSTACATVHARPSFSAFGEADPEIDAQVLNAFVAARDEPLDEDEAAIKVLIDTLPDGVELNDGVLRVKEGYPYELLGRFRLDPAAGNTLFFADYTSSARKGFCWPQVVLSWVTLGIWAIIVPTSYPCWGSSETSRRELIAEVKRFAHTAGGNLVIASYVQGTSPNTAFGAYGFILHVLDRVPGSDSGEDRSTDRQKKRFL